MKLALVALLRNEADIAGAFLRHAGALFDYAVLMDHHSVDGTGALLAAACAGRPGWECWRVAPPGFHQREFSQFAMRHLFERTDADFVIFLDADEFIDVPGRAGLERRLAELGHERDVGRFTWSNCVPHRLDRTTRIGETIWMNPEPSRFKKIVVPRPFFDSTGGRAAPSFGNHVVTPGDGGEVRYQPIGRLLHLPLRSMDQMRRKAVMGALVELARADRAPGENVHWFESARRVAEGSLAEADLIGAALYYGDAGSALRPIARAELAGRGVKRRLDVAAERGRRAVLPQPPDPWRLVAGVVGSWNTAEAGAPRLRLRGGVLGPE